MQSYSCNDELLTLLPYYNKTVLVVTYLSSIFSLSIMFGRFQFVFLIKQAFNLIKVLYKIKQWWYKFN